MRVSSRRKACAHKLTDSASHLATPTGVVQRSVGQLLGLAIEPTVLRDHHQALRDRRRRQHMVSTKQIHNLLCVPGGSSCSRQTKLQSKNPKYIRSEHTSRYSHATGLTVHCSSLFQASSILVSSCLSGRHCSPLILDLKHMHHSIMQQRFVLLLSHTPKGIHTSLFLSLLDVEPGGSRPRSLT
jgi:hypothetical protein